ncbi:MAG TPA: T9SS type A sorting domain-containing protein [Chitinophagales bacterium]|nr:T9SS type A sorting domain-containing protein [Chitinophagales bacterium]
MKTLSTLFALCLLLSFTTLHAQAPAILWQKCLGGSGTEGISLATNFQFPPLNPATIQQTPDGGYIFAGNSTSNNGDVTGNHGGSDYWVVKMDSVGNLVWQKSYGGSNNDLATSVDQTSDGGYVVAGHTYSSDGDVEGLHGTDADSWVIKLDGTGNLQWQRALGGSRYDGARSIKQTADGGYIVACFTQSVNDGDVSGFHLGWGDYWIVKLDGVGNLLWQNCLGGGDFDVPYSIQPTLDGGYVVAGYSQSADGDVIGHSDCSYGAPKDYCAPNSWIVKLDADGNIQLQKCLKFESVEKAYSIVQTSDAGYAMVGEGAYSSTAPSNVYAVKLDSTGNVTWRKSFGGSGSDIGYSIRQLSDGRYIIAGFTASSDGDITNNHGVNDFWIFALDASGNLQWQKSFGGTGSDVGNSIQQTSDGGFALAGYSESNDGDVSGNHGARDYWVMKLQKEDTAVITLPLALSGLCTSQTVSVGYSVIRNFNTGNIFTAQLSDASGSFGTPVNIGSLASTTSGTIQATIPSNVSGLHYRIRVVSSNPVRIGTDNKGDLILNSTTPPAADAAITSAGATTICTPQTVTLSVASSGFTYQWKKGGAAISGATLQSFTASSTGAYSCDVGNTCGITSSNSITVTVNGYPISPQAAITAGGPTALCSGENVVLTVATAGLTYQWRKGTKDISGATAQSFTVNKSASYVCVVSNNCGAILSNSITVTINPRPTASVSAAPCSGGAVLLTCAFTPGSGVTFQWTKGNVNVNGATNPTFSATSKGTYKCLVTSTATGCTKLSNGAKVTITCKVGDVVNEDKVIVYPNPTSDYFNINTEQLDPQSVIYIYDLTGRLVESHQVNGEEMKVGEALANGVYFLKIAGNNEKMEVIKLVKNF